jgi:ATP-dependent metalloprotease
VDFLKDPDRYKKAGAKMPKGVLFHGKPGTGKTELARAVANEAGCTFYYQSAAEFMDSIVGQGVTKIQNLFAKARENSPAIIFLDEIDSLASDRSLSMSRYNSMELNQILTEMDGFTPDDKVIVIAATNMIESLDKAILRAGRFDKKIDIPLPDKASRVKLFQFFSKKIKVKGHIDFDTLAKRTTGMTGADIKNMTNLAILHSIKMNRNEATQEDFEYAFDRMVMGVYRKNLTMDEQTKKMTAYHEAGHTLMNLLTQSGMGLHKVTILPVGQSLGHTALTPAIENNQFTSSNLTSMLDVAMGGRIAEELIFGHQDLSTGCSQDLKQASKIANELVRNMGYSSLKTIVLSGETKNMSEVTNEQSDAEVERLLRVD